MEIYDAIVDGFKEKKPSNIRIEEYLKSLQQPVKSLRLAYRNSPINVPYEKVDIQAAYLATYLPHYYQLIYKIFIEEVPDIFINKKKLYLTFIGGGPGSEVYGALKYIFNNCNEVEDVYINILDINASTWDYSHSIVQKNLLDSINKRNVNIHWDSIQFDLVSDVEMQKIKSLIKKSDLLVIQNCLNEIATSNLSVLKSNLKTLFEYLPDNSYLLISDLTSGARTTIKVLEKYLIDCCAPKFIKSTLSQPSPRSLQSVHHRPSTIITQNLLLGTDGLIPRKNLNYDYSILSKGIIEKPIDYKALGFNALYRPLDFKKLDANDYIHKKIFIGIDFGTSSTVVSTAQLIGEKIEIKAIPIKQKNHLGSTTSSPLVPTIMSISNNKFMVGVHAADYKPFLKLGKDTWHSFKQNLGNLENIEYPSSILAKHPTNKISNATEALTYFFKYLKDQIFEYLKSDGLPTEGIEYSISIPAGFPSKEKKMLKSCLINGGIECEDTPFIEEPNAALINYLFEQNIYVETNIPKNILVLDLGAGTVDVSILRAENSNDGFTSQLLSVLRQGHIGGNLIDQLIADSIIYNSGLTLSKNEHHYLELQSFCEKLKIKLCKTIITDKSVSYELPPLNISSEIRSIAVSNSLKSIGIDSIGITFNEFKNIMQSYWKEVADTIDNSIENAEINISSINKVIVTGGGGRNPYIQNLIVNYFKNSDVFISDNIQEQVSRGAALQSFVLNSFGKNIITPILGHDIYLKGENDSIPLFTNGISIPSMEIEIEIDNLISSSEKSIACYSDENNDYKKYFIFPANISATKLIFYIAPDQELRCEIIGSNYEKEALEKFTEPIDKLIKIK
ncbi:Hsp70 family protein [Chryseobacterium aquaticum]|uniref:Hsp70 family protein n=1 Tax=Chryseobacterium aquaticum TaxID=452084 RepID=A0A848N7L6_9FLAO|nr:MULTISPECIES: Hsp70 family protein [Chryseobacterium]NMR35474.1 Hsp70 family protein [Chryseobacterium aquaticum]NRQ47550.1 Hsp70 family protein [Chryseobacterium sp. C-204]